MMALSPDLGAAGNVLVFIVCTCNWFNGIIIPYNQIQVFWRYWVSPPHERKSLGVTEANQQRSSTTCRPLHICLVEWSRPLPVVSM